jgi:hypothetical protein
MEHLTQSFNSVVSFVIPNVDLKFPVFVNSEEPGQLQVGQLPVAVRVEKNNAEEALLNEGDQAPRCSNRLEHLHEYRMAPGYTRESLAPQMEYMGPLKTRIEQLHCKYQTSFSPIATEINKKKQSAAGLAEVTSALPQYTERLFEASRKVGFGGRDSEYAQFTLLSNLLHARYGARVNDMIGEIGSSKAKGIEEQLSHFFTKEPWETQCKYLLDGVIKVQNGMTAAKMGSTLTTLQNGGLETPSFHINYTDMIDPQCGHQVSGAVDRLEKFLKHSTMGIYELRFVLPHGTTHTASEVCAKILPLFKALGCGDVKVELLRICGTTNIHREEIADHQKVLTQILKALNGGKFLSTLERLDISNNYVDFETLQLLSELMSTCSVTALNMSRVHLGLLPAGPKSVTVPTRKGDCMDTCNICCFTHDCDMKRCCCIAPCMSCNKVVDNEGLGGRIDEALQQFRNENKQMLGHHQGGFHLRQLFKNMRSRPNPDGEDFKLDVIDFSHSNLSQLCGGAEGVAKLLEVVGDCRPTAINLVGCGLTDLHAYGLSCLFCRNPTMIHFSASMCTSDLESIEILQNLVQNSPILISGKLECSGAAWMRVHNQTTEAKTEKNLCCLIGKESPVFCAYPLCLKVHTTTHHQTHDTFQLPANPLDVSDYSHYANAMSKSLHEHRVLPVFTLLMKLCNSERKRDKLARAALDEKYNQVFREDVDHAKVSILEEFALSVGLEFSVEHAMQQMAERMMTRVMTGGAQALEDGKVFIEAVKEVKPMPLPALQN